MFKDRQRQVREAAIVQAARELIATKGYLAMSIEDVIETVGISKPTFYAHFTGKEELGVRVLIWRWMSSSHRFVVYAPGIVDD